MPSRKLRLLLVATIAITIGAGVFVTLTRESGAPEPNAIRGVATYPLGTRSIAVAQADGRGRVTICYRGGARLELGDITKNRIYFVEGDLKWLPLPCRGATPRTLVRIRDLLGRAPRSTQGGGVLETIESPLESPDGKRVAFELRECSGEGFTCSSRLYTTTPQGAGARRVGEHQLIGWADATHVVSGRGTWDPVAYNVEEAEQRFLSFPRAWFGKFTPDGRRAFFKLGPVTQGHLRGLYKQGTFELDRAAGAQQPIALDPGVFNGFPDSSGSRFVELSGDQTRSGGALIRVYGQGVVTKVFQSPVSLGRGCDPDLGWFDEGRAWVFDACGAALVDLASGRVTKLTLPELDVAGLDEPETRFVSLYDRVTEPLVDPTVKDTAVSPMTTSAVPGIRLTLPPAWRAQPCRCGPRAYPAASLIAGDEPMLLFRGLGYELTVAVTPDSTARALRALRSEYAKGRMPPGRRGEAIDAVATKQRRLGNIVMTALELQSGHGATAMVDTVLVGRNGGRTYIITIYGEGRVDPSVEYILRAIQFP